MTQEVQAWKKKRRRLWLGLAALLVLLAVVVMPSLVSMNRYKSRITQLLSESLGRPVRLSSVELRLLPLPGFVLTDLTVQEDPAYGAEPVLHANTVTASIRLLSLLGGHVQIGTISVDEASLNVVRTADGKWNLDPLFRTAAAKAQPAAASGNRRQMPLPYLQATNSRINFKHGAEKLPFSLVETDLSFWQEQPGDWRIRLRGQPARTDVNLDLADTGIVRLEARAQRAPELRQMPIHVDLQWSEAQLGQLSRLLIGSDPGWRGDLTGEIHVDGTAEMAQIKTRLRATGVHRAEFAPAAPMDFDASCGGTYHYPAGALEGLLCDSPLGDGRVRLSGDLPGDGKAPHLSVELDKIPVAAGLDALRTVRSDLGVGLEAAGTVSGKITYAAVAPAQAPVPQAAARRRGKASANARPAAPGPLTGSFTVDGFQLSGDGLSTPITAAKLVLTPVFLPASGPGPAQGSTASASSAAVKTALEAAMSIPAGGATPLAVVARLGRGGYELTIRGQASIARAREMARMAGLPDPAAFDSLAGEPVGIDLAAEGPWLPAPEAALAGPVSAAGVPAGSLAGDQVATAPAAAAPVLDGSGAFADVLRGTVTLRNANWKAGFLANPVEISQATLHLGQGDLLWDPVAFTYGPVKGTASITVPVHCKPGPACLPSFQVQFGQLDAGVLQSALLGAHEPGTLLSTLIDRLRSADKSAPAWPPLEGTVKADSFLLGPITLAAASATVRIDASGAAIESLDADLLGGQVHGTGTFALSNGKPDYFFTGEAEKLNPAQVGRLIGLQASGRAFNAAGKIQLSGFSGEDLPGFSQGTFSFEVDHGTLKAGQGAGPIPPALARFDHWKGDGTVSNGSITLKDTVAQDGARKRFVNAHITFGEPAKVTFPVPRESVSKP
jgi:hypothetical protein